ncbi:MAG: MarR family transcriptional regulator [Ruminococcus sp.]|nr:MarR family transcriptional regulator [Ruminococcus sp.]
MEEKKSVSFELHRTSKLIKRRLDGEKPINMPTAAHGRIIGFIANENRDVFQRDIEKELNIRRSTATNILKLMEKNGLLTRESVSSDARLKKLVLTEKAQELHEAVLENFKTLEEKLRRGISQQELDIFFNVLDKLNQNLKEDDAND